MGIVIIQVRCQTRDEFRGRGEVAAFQEASSQGAEPQLHLVEPRTVLGREMKNVFVCGIGQEGFPLRAGT